MSYISFIKIVLVHFFQRVNCKFIPCFANRTSNLFNSHRSDFHAFPALEELPISLFACVLAILDDHPTA